MKFGFDWKRFWKVVKNTIGEFFIIIASISLAAYLTSSGTNGFPMYMNLWLIFFGVLIRTSLE